MKTRSAIILFMSLLASASLPGCGEGGGEWVIIDTVHAPVDSLVVANQHAVNETLSIRIVAEDAWEEVYSAAIMRFSHLEVEREGDTLELSARGDLCDWQGGGVMPPCGGCGFEHEHQELPPFEEGDFRIIVHQPDGSALEDTVAMIP